MAKINYIGKTDNIKKENFNYIKIIKSPQNGETIYFQMGAKNGNGEQIILNHEYKISDCSSVHFDSTLQCETEYELY